MTTIREITVDDLAAALRDSDPPMLLDVRGHAEYATGHVPGAVNIALDELPERLGELRGSAQIAAICQSGRRSAQAAEQLGATGIDVVSVAGGTSAWVESGRPTLSGRRPPVQPHPEEESS
ncbi:rhodanese-like domain-containing protein [Actinomycetospora straminea]|uniref:Rhodanese domain-containing protein n=1 Tax=Actinomycetospora straminea TaxID=663607 RepID=A0ABP9E8L4_9PSEU|nr:rhodanese-like domain-containing protein [Actinomycetospora straminea]MDD7931932.1 rhodanese-like domain-containing protein [Actinomycetospora straminea]